MLIVNAENFNCLECVDGFFLLDHHSCSYVSTLLYSLIEMAKSNKLEPYASLCYIFENLPTASSLENYEDLLLWNITPEQMHCPRLVESA